MEAYKSGDVAGFENLYSCLYEPLYCFLFRYTCEEQLSIDLVQDAFERLQYVKDDFNQQKGTVKAFLFQIAYRLMINKLNRRKKWHTLFPFLTPTPSYRLSSEDKLTVQQAILQLPDKQRAVILLAYYHDLPQEEIAQILSIPLGTVKSRLHNAMKFLKEELKEDFDAKG